MSRYRSVVLVDDSADDNFVNAFYLRRAEWAQEVVCYDEPEDALAALKEAVAPEVLFVDLNMPGMTGLELVEALSEASLDLSGTRVVVLTSSVHPEDRRRAEKAGLIDAYVEKPLDLATLERLATALGSAQKPGVK